MTVDELITKLKNAKIPNHVIMTTDDNGCAIEATEIEILNSGFTDGVGHGDEVWIS